MKSTLITLLVSCLCLAGCGKKKAEPTAEKSSNVNSTVSTSIVADYGVEVDPDPGNGGSPAKNKPPTEEEKKFAEIMARAKANDAEAQFELGERYYIGKMGVGRYGGNPVEQDFQEAFKWYLKAAKLNHPKAQYEVGLEYAVGNVVDEDNKEKVKWYRKAAEQNVPQAQFSLGSAYFFGDGVEKDVVRGYAWQTIAVSGDRTVDGAVAELDFKRWKTHHSKMTKEQIDEAKELAKEMIAKNPKLIQRKK